MTELEHIRNNYCDRGCIKIHMMGKDNSILADRTCDYIWKYGTDNSSKRPDIIAETDTEVVGIEHFVFDSSKQTLNGSSFTKTDKLQVKDMEKCNLEALRTGHDTSTETRSNDQELTLGNYLKNYMDNFASHALKIEDYIDAIPTVKGKRKQVWFFAENIDPCGAYYETGEYENGLLHPFMFEQAIALLEKNLRLNGVIYGMESRGEAGVLVLHNNPSTLSEQRQKLSNTRKFTTRFPHGILTSFVAKVPNN